MMAKRTQTTARPSTTTPPARNQPIASTSIAKAALSDPINFSIMVATIVGVAAAVGLGGYQIGKDVGQTELKMRQDLAALDLPKIAADTRSSTGDLKTAASEFKDLLVNNATYRQAMSKQAEQLKTIEQLTGQVEAFEEQSKRQKQTITTLTNRLVVHENPDRLYNLEKGTSQQIGGELIVGLQYNLMSFAEITINGERHSAQAGDVIEAKGLKGASCSLKLVSVSEPDKASFSAECSK